MPTAAQGDITGGEVPAGPTSPFAPAPGAAPLSRMIAAQARLETRTLLRNGEQLLLTLIIPLLLLAAFSLEPLVNFGAGLSRIDFLTPGIIALAVMSTAFTSQAIATGFERRYGVLKRLGATPLSRGGLIAAKTTTVIAVELLQALLILAVALAIGWRPDASPAAILVAPLHVMVGAQAWLELRTLLRNGEQLVLTLIIPVLLIAAFSQEDLVSYGPGSRIDFLAPGILALAVMSTAFTSQAIATGFERRYGVLKRLGATPLSRRGLIAAKTLTVLAVEVLQSALIVVVALALGWNPRGGAAAAVWSVVLMVVGTAAFSGLALLLAGTLRAEATLAAANLIYLVMLGIGGVVFPLTKFPAGARPLLRLLPSGALSDGLRSMLQLGGGLPARDLLVLAVWAVVGIGFAVRTFRWE